jgi:hypothetical protein
LIYTTRHYLPRAFTVDDDVVDAVATVLLLVGVFQLFDHTQGVLSGILRGCGLQLYGAVVNVVGYYAIAAPVLGVAAFVAHLEGEFLPCTYIPTRLCHAIVNLVQGLWTGLICGVAFQAIALGLRVYRIDWPLEARKAVARSEMPADQEDDTPTKDVAMLVLDEDVQVNGEGDDTMLLEDSHVMGKKPDWLDLKLKDIPWRIKKQQLFATAVLVLILVGAIVASATYHRRPVCYPLPAVANASATCRGKSSLIAGHSCGVTCEQGWVASGQFACGLDGQLATIAVCLHNTSADVLPS